MLSRLVLQNFRRFDHYSVEFDGRTLLVGPNNAGKSTIIEALRLVAAVVNRLRSLNFDRAPEWLGQLESTRGVSPSLRGLEFDLGRETFHNYAEPPAIITAEFASGSKIVTYLGSGADVFAVVYDPDGGALATKSDARRAALPRIGIQPQVGPLARSERPLRDQYVRGALDSSLAPGHFRNQLKLLTKHYDRFKELAEQSWPGLVIDGLEGIGLGEDRRLGLFIRDGAFVGEVAAMGHGLQMWLQLMWFLARSAEDGTVVLDEPDVYMHPDLQRRLLRIILARDQQVIVATHSIEMMAEVDPDDLVVIDSTKRRARRTRSIAELQQVVEQLGGVHNLAFARLARASACILAPVSDLRLLERWQQLVEPRDSETLAVLPTFPCEGWDAWPFVRAAKRSIDAVRSEPIRALCFLPGGGLPPDFVSARLVELPFRTSRSLFLHPSFGTAGDLE